MTYFKHLDVWAGVNSVENLLEESCINCALGVGASLCFSVSLLKRERKMSRKGTCGYTSP